MVSGTVPADYPEISEFLQKMKIKTGLFGYQKEDVLEKNPGLLTTKEDRGHHGIGLSVVRSIAAKYQGNFQARWENGYFCVTVMLLG